MKHEKGNWQVTRNCCTSGNCVDCHGANGRGSVRVLQADGYSERYARFVANNWKSYDAVAEPMPPDRLKLQREAHAVNPNLCDPHTCGCQHQHQHTGGN